MSEVRVFGVGHVSLDHVFTVAAAPAAGLKTPARRYRTLVGGMTGNAVLAAARLQAKSAIVSPVGDDAAAALFAEHFQREGVDVRGLQRMAGANSSTSAIMVDDSGERTIVNHRGSALTQCGALDSTQLEGAACVLTDPRCVAWAETALRIARARRVPSVFDGDSAPRDDLRRLVGLAEWAVFSEPGLAAYSDAGVTDALAQALDAGARVAVVTLGENGLIWRCASATGPSPPVHLAAFPVPQVADTTAAGDVFHGGLAVALAEGLSERNALRFAAAAAALKCRRPDGVLGAPYREQVEELLAGNEA